MALDPQERAQRINEWRAHYNDQLKDIGFEAPLPKAGQSVGGYRRFVAQTIADSLLPQTHSFAKMDWRDMPFDAYKNLEPQHLTHAVTEWQNPLNVPRGEFRTITRKLPNGQECTEYIGQDSFCKFMTRPGRRVLGFRDDSGHYVNTNGRVIR
jgi:hypothetical protein